MGWSVRMRKIGAETLGYFCICIFFVLTTQIVYVYYEAIIPNAWQSKNYFHFFFHTTFGNWIAINIYFNFIMASITSPGLAKDCQHLTTQYPTCKKCSTKKPPRTHHCRWCDRCVLKYDHHCPWLNNCVGFYNHRYFFQFCCFMATGCMYAGTMGYREYQIARLGEVRFTYMDSFLRPLVVMTAFETVIDFITYFIFVATLITSFLLTGLICWHARMISRGITSVERLLHRDYAEQSAERGFLFVNTYNFGLVENWKRFFNVRTVGDFIGHVLLPSTHKPRGNGIVWAGCDVHSYLQSHQSDEESSARPLAFPPEAHLNSARSYPSSKDQCSTPLPNKQTKSASYTRPEFQPSMPTQKSMGSKKDR